MKWLFLILLIGNAAFFAYQQHNASEDSFNAMTEQPGPGHGGIVLLSEQQSPHAADIATVISESCYQVEGFALLEDAQVSLDKLIDAGFVGEIVENQSQVLSSYWVISKIFPNQAEAVKLLREMRTASVDSYVIDSGNHKNAVSVGLFKKRHHAESRKKAVSQKGFEVHIVENYKSVADYTLNVSYRGMRQAPPLRPVLQSGSGQVVINEKKCQQNPH